MAPQERSPCCEQEDDSRQNTSIDKNLSNIDLAGGFVNKGYINDSSDVASAKIPEKKEESGENMKKPTDFDDLLPYVGEFGIYQKILFLLMIPFAFYVAFVYFAQIFMTIVPEQHWCWVPELANLTVEERRALAIPPNTDGIYSHDRCHMYSADWAAALAQGRTTPDDEWEIIPCTHGWEYNRSDVPYETIATQLRDKEERRRRRSRSWERRARQRRHAREHDDRRPDKSRRPSSRSPSPRGRYRNRSPPALDRPASRSRSRSPVPVRDRDHERDRLRMTREIERDRMSRDRDHRERVTSSRDRDRSRDRSRSLSPMPDNRLDHEAVFKRRCRDFDEKGYCMRGDLCQWDHGTDPVVLEDAALTRVLTVPPAVPEYNPLTPDIWGGAALPFVTPLAPHAPHAPLTPRELIPIPSRVRHEVPPHPPHAARHPPPKKNFDYNRLGAARPPLPPSAANCSLEVKKVPRGMNDITHLNNHFCKFGKIVNIQVCYEGDPEAALITFSNPTEANIAYKSTEAVLNNRFIKVFWHNPENKQDMSNQNKPQNDRNGQHPMSFNKVLINRTEQNTKVTEKPLEKNKQDMSNQNKPQNDRNGQHPMSFNKVLINRTEQNTKVTEKPLEKPQQQTKETANGQEPKKEAPKPMEKFKMITEMYKRARALLDTQLQQQKLLIDKLEAGNVTPQQKSALLEAINSSQEGIEKLNKEVKAYSKTLSQLQAKKPKTRVEAEKEILDAELDLFTKQQEGQDVTELLKKVAELRRQMAINFPSVPPSRKPYSRGGRFNTSSYIRAPAPKQFPHSMNQSVDRRPRALLVSGFEADELDALVTHFSQFGTITHKDVNLAVPELMVMYATRANAEHAVQAGKHYNDRTLSITWVVNPKLPTNVPSSSERPQNNTNGDTTPQESKEAEQQTRSTSEDALLRFDEEEDEDAEDRSWRR